jgi:hypothetical protein
MTTQVTREGEVIGQQERGIESEASECEKERSSYQEE